ANCQTKHTHFFVHRIFPKNRRVRYYPDRQTTACYSRYHKISTILQMYCRVLNPELFAPFSNLSFYQTDNLLDHVLRTNEQRILWPFLSPVLRAVSSKNEQY